MAEITTHGSCCVCYGITNFSIYHCKLKLVIHANFVVTNYCYKRHKIYFLFLILSTSTIVDSRVSFMNRNLIDRLNLGEEGRKFFQTIISYSSLQYQKCAMTLMK